MYRLELKDDIDSIDFLSTTQSAFSLIDGTFQMSDPEYDVSDEKYVSQWLGAMNSRKYGPREVSFSVIIRGQTRDNVLSALGRLIRMASRSMSSRHKNASSFFTRYGHNPFFAANVPGQQGLQLILRYGNSSPQNRTGVFGQSYTDNLETYFYVISMDVSNLQLFSTEQSMTLGGREVLYSVDIKLSVSAFGYGNPVQISIATGSGGFSAFPAPIESNGYGAKTFIPASQVPGEGEALTHITMNVHNVPGFGSGSGVIIARDVGRSLLNCPSAFVNSTTNQPHILSNTIIPLGYDTATNNYYDVQITQTNPLRVRYRINGGAWSSNIIPSAYQVINVASGAGYDFSFLVTTTQVSDIYNNVILRCYSSGYFAPPPSSISIGTYLSLFLGENGYGLQDMRIVVPEGVHGKYKILFGVTTGSGNVVLEYRATLFAEGPNYTNTIYRTNWVSLPPLTSMGMVDLGVLDLSVASTPQTMLPGGYSLFQISVSGRLVSNVTGGTVTPYGIWLVPCDDERSYLRVAWNVISNWPGFQLITNFDPRKSLITMVNRDYRTGFSGISQPSMVTSLQQTHEGAPITLIPNIENTLLFIPLFGVNQDYRTAIPTTGIRTGTTTLSIRPAYYAAR
jgi:hypothetical protein